MRTLGDLARMARHELLLLALGAVPPIKRRLVYCVLSGTPPPVVRLARRIPPLRLRA